MSKIPIEVHREAHENRLIVGIESPKHNIDTPVIDCALIPVGL